MKGKPDKKMSVEDRAKQFAPFAALRGLEEALKKVEKRFEEEQVPKGPNEDYNDIP